MDRSAFWHKISFLARLGLRAGWYALFILAYPAYENALGLLCVDSGPVQAQAIVMLGGGTPERQIRAAELYLQGAAPMVIASGDGEPETAPLLLEKHGIPRTAIVVESKSKSTWQNAAFTRPILAEHGVTNVILVTSWFHSRRSMHTFQRLMPEVQFHSRPTYWGARRADWRRCGLRRYVFMEFLKTPWYWLRGALPGA